MFHRKVFLRIPGSFFKVKEDEDSKDVSYMSCMCMCASLCVSVCVCVPVCFCSMHRIGISLCAKGVRPIEGNCKGVCVCVPYMCLFARVSVCACVSSSTQGAHMCTKGTPWGNLLRPVNMCLAVFFKCLLR